MRHLVLSVVLLGSLVFAHFPRDATHVGGRSCDPNRPDDCPRGQQCIQQGGAWQCCGKDKCN